MECDRRGVVVTVFRVSDISHLVGKISASTFLYDGKLQIISGCEVLAASHELNQAEIFPTNKLEDCKAIERVA